MITHMIHPAFLDIVGWSPEVNNEEMITVIRRQVRYDEVVMTREEFEQMNQQMCNGQDEDLEWETKEKLDSSMKDIEYTEPVEYYYTAIVGDVTSATDDVIFTAPLEWTDGGDLYDEGIQLCEMNVVDCMMRG